MRVRHLIFLALFLAFLSAKAQALEAGLRTTQIKVRSDFTGTRLLVFGALDAPLTAAQNVAIVVRGPQRRGAVWRKERIAGIWTNYTQKDFSSLGGFYGLATMRPIAQKPPTLAFDPPDSMPPDFVAALARLMRAKGLFYEAPQAVEFLGARLFRAEIALPAVAPIGDYKIEVHLLDRGKARASQTLSLHLDKIGFGQFIFSFANDWPFFYGLAAVLIALSFGWLMSVVFRRLF